MVSTQNDIFRFPGPDVYARRGSFCNKNPVAAKATTGSVIFIRR